MNFYYLFFCGYVIGTNIKLIVSAHYYLVNVLGRNIKCVPIAAFCKLLTSLLYTKNKWWKYKQRWKKVYVGTFR